MRPDVAPSVSVPCVAVICTGPSWLAPPPTTLSMSTSFRPVSSRRPVASSVTSLLVPSVCRLTSPARAVVPALMMMSRWAVKLPPSVSVSRASTVMSEPTPRAMNSPLSTAAPVGAKRMLPDIVSMRLLAVNVTADVPAALVPAYSSMAL